MRLDLISRYRSKFGKAARKKLSSIEESILMNQVRKKIELEEARKNILDTEEFEKKKSEQDLWGRLKFSIDYITKHEPWVTASMLEESNTDDQRCILFGRKEKKEISQEVPVTKSDPSRNQEENDLKLFINTDRKKEETGNIALVESDIDDIDEKKENVEGVENSENVEFGKSDSEFEFGRKEEEKEDKDITHASSENQETSLEDPNLVSVSSRKIKISDMHSVYSRETVASSPLRRKDPVTAISEMRYCESFPRGGGGL